MHLLHNRRQVIWSLLLFAFVQAQTTIIDIPQRFVLGSDIVATDTTENLFEITVGDVILELDEHIISGGRNGVVVSPNLEGVEIRNGTIQDMVEKGVVVGDGVADLKLHNLTISGCADCAIELQGTSTNPIASASITLVTTEESGSSTATTAVIKACFSNNLFFLNSTINNNTNTTRAISLLQLLSCSRCSLINLAMLNNSAIGLILLDVDNTTDSLFQTISMRNNTATVGALTSVQLTNSASFNKFENCLTLDSMASTGTCTGYDLQEGAVSNLFTSCQVVDSSAADFHGFLLSGLGTPSSTSFNSFKDCLATSNIASTGEANGMVLRNSDQGIIQDCAFEFNRAPAGRAVGLLFESGTGGDNWAIRNSQMIRNIGSSNANSFGVLVQTGADNLFVQNLAFQNGATAGNQLSGVPIGSVSLQLISDLNLLTAPWTNIAINT